MLYVITFKIQFLQFDSILLKLFILHEGATYFLLKFNKLVQSRCYPPGGTGGAIRRHIIILINTISINH
jgi:hypothetical protein